MRYKLTLFLTLLIISPLVSKANEFYIAKTELNVRIGAGTEYSVFFTLGKGDEVEILGRDNEWYKISYLGKSGYVRSKYLKYSRTVSDTEFNVQDKPDFLLLVLIGIVILVAGFILFRNIQDKKLLKTVTELNRGTKTERNLVLTLLKFGISKENIFHDLYVEKSNSHFSQIDLVVVSDIGIIVFEVKDYSGWIYGTGSQLQWTQVLAYGRRKYRLYNPIMQNGKHIVELRKRLTQSQNIPFYSVVVFYGDCVLKKINYVPSGTFLVKSQKVITALKQLLKDNISAGYYDKSEIVQILRESVINGGIENNQIMHRESIRDMLGQHRIFE